MKVELIAVESMPEVEPGDDLAALILQAMKRQSLSLEDGDIVVVTHKVVSKAEGAVRTVLGDDDYRRLVETEAAAIVRRRGDLVITETRHGFICANAGVDRSNATPGTAVLLPADPDRSAHRLRGKLENASGADLGLIVTDTFGRAWRRGVTDVAIGVSGVPVIIDYRGRRDTSGRVMEATEVAVADEIAAASDLVMGKATGVPVAIVRGVRFTEVPGRAAHLVRDPAEDLFR